MTGPGNAGGGDQVVRRGPIEWLWPRLVARARWALMLKNRLRLTVLDSLTLASLEIGQQCSFEVPTRVAGGRGRIWIGDENIFGSPSSPRVGDGSILLQPRDPQAQIVVGRGNLFSNNVSLCANQRIAIGDGCLIGDGVCVFDSDFHETTPLARREQGQVAPVILGNNVWLGSRVMVLKGVEIGDNSVVGAMSVVTRSVPPNSVAVGVPARVVRTL